MMISKYNDKLNTHVNMVYLQLSNRKNISVTKTMIVIDFMQR